METNSLTSTYRKSIGTSQTGVNASLMPKSEVTIGKILCVNAKACVDNVEVLNGEARYSGTVNFEALFTNEAGEYFSENQTMPFNGKIEDSQLNSSMQPVDKVEVVEVNITHASTTEIDVDCIVEVTLDCIVTDSVQEVVNCGEDIELKSNNIKCVSLVTVGNKTFNIDEEYDVKASVDKILFSDAQVIINSASAGDKFLTIKGDVYLNAIAVVNNGEAKELTSINQAIPFEEELADDLIAPTNMVLAYAHLNPANVKVTVMSPVKENEASNVVKVDIIVDVKYIALKEEEKQVCLDAYSVTHKINTVMDSFNNTTVLKTNNFTEKIDGSTTLGDDQPRIAKIVSVYGAKATVTHTYASENTINVEGIGNATVVYLTDEDEKLNSALVEIPFSVKLSEDGITDQDKCFTKINVKDVDAKTKKGKEIDLEMELSIRADTYSYSPEVAIKEIELTEEIQPSEYALQIFLAPKGSSLWDIAKHLQIKQGIIEKQNPNLVYPLEKNESIVYFRE